MLLDDLQPGQFFAQQGSDALPDATALENETKEKAR